MSITGERDGPPMKVGVALADISTGMFAANAILAALLARERIEEGQHIDMALLDSQVALLGISGSSYLCSDEVPQRWGNAHSSIVPYQAFQAADDYLILAIGNDGQWQRFCIAAGVESWASDERFATNVQRVAHRDLLLPLLEDLFRQNTVTQWVELCTDVDVPCGPVNTLDKVFSDPQVLAREMLVEMPHSTAETVRLAGTPMNLSQTPTQKKFLGIGLPLMTRRLHNCVGIKPFEPKT